MRWPCAAIGLCCPALRQLGVYGLDEITTQAARELLLRARQLRKIDLGGCGKIPGADIEGLAKQFARVTF